MMLRLLVVSLSLFALGSAQGPQVELQEHPLITTMIRYLNQTIPCTGPCALDSIAYIIGEINNPGEIVQCVNRFVEDVENSFVTQPPSSSINPQQYYAMQWLQAFYRPAEICPKLDRIASCFASASANVCGGSSQEEAKKVMKSLLTFLDCDVPVSRQLLLLECVYPVMTIFDPAPPPGIYNFSLCIDPSLNYFGQAYDTVYYDISGPKFYIFEGHVRNLLQCYMDWNPSNMLTNGRCDNAVAHINKQLNSLMYWLRDGEGRSMFTCLGDQRLYQDPNFESCINTFTTNGGDLIRRVSDAIQTGNMANVQQYLKEIAMDTCRTQAVPELIRCFERILESRPGKRCGEVVIPTARNLYMPSLQYMYLLGGCSSRISSGNPLYQSRVCQCARYIPDYSFRPEVSSQCQKPAPQVLNLQTIIIIVVVGVLGVMLIIVLLVCCCCNNSGCSWCCPRRRQQVHHEKTVVHVPATKYMYPGVHQGLCVQQARVMSPYGQCSCQSPPTKTILQFQ